MGNIAGGTLSSKIESTARSAVCKSLRVGLVAEVGKGAVDIGEK